MKFFYLIVIVALFVPISADAVLIGRNIIENGSFENRPGGEDEDPRGWSSRNSEYNGLAINEYRKGSQAAYLVCPKTNDSNGIFFTYNEVEPAEEYAFSCYVKNSLKEPLKGNVIGRISIEWLKKDKDEDDNNILVEISRDWGPKFGPELPVIKWVPVTMTAIAPADADSCRFVIQFFNNGEGGGTFFVEDASAEKLNPFFKDKSNNTTPIKIDENFDEWKKIEPLTVDSTGDVAETEQVNFSKVWANPAGKSLYISYCCTKPINFEGEAYRYNVFIDVDNDINTGYRGWDGNWPLGADYLVQGATVFEFSGSTNRAWEWKKGEIVTYRIKEDQVEMKIPLSSLGLKNKQEFRVLFYGDNINEADYVPDDHIDRALNVKTKQ